MRKLNSKDLMTVVKIVGKVGTTLKPEPDATEAQLGINFFASALIYAESDIKPLLASVAEMTEEEFDKMPFDYPLEVIEWLAENEDLGAFFTRVKQLSGRLFQ